MARGLFITGFTIAEALAIQGRAKELLLEGKTVMNWNDTDTTVSKQFAITVLEVLEECGHALRILDQLLFPALRSGPGLYTQIRADFPRVPGGGGNN